MKVGRWTIPSGADAQQFVPARHQPTGAASTDVSKLRIWLAQKENMEALMAEGFFSVQSIRMELAEADFNEIKVLKARVR